MSEKGSNMRFEQRWPLRKIPGATSERLDFKSPWKVVAKQAIKEFQSGPNNLSFYQRCKKLGIFMTIDDGLQFGIDDPGTDFNANFESSCISLHLPRTSTRTLIDQGSASLQLLADYIKLHSLEPECIIGITYGRLAILASRQLGFNLYYPSFIPNHIKTDLASLYNKRLKKTRKGREMGKIGVIYMETSEFLEKYGTDE